MRVCVCVRLCVRVAPQDLLDTPNPQSPAQQSAYNIFTTSKSEYERMVRNQVAQNKPDRYE